MKKLTEYINESLWSKITNRTYRPRTKKELKELIERLIEERGLNADLNDIDTSKITDMIGLFQDSKFNGDISKWNVSNVKYMNNMFWMSDFNGDISKWNVSKVKEMTWMFYRSKFNGDISKWDVRNVENMTGMFQSSDFNGDISKWKLSDTVDISAWLVDCPLGKKEDEYSQRIYDKGYYPDIHYRD